MIVVIVVVFVGLELKKETRLVFEWRIESEELGMEN
jgi:hypothetical protein